MSCAAIVFAFLAGVGVMAAGIGYGKYMQAKGEALVACHELR